MSRKLQPINQKDFNHILIEDLEMIQKENVKKKTRIGKFKCFTCNKIFISEIKTQKKLKKTHCIKCCNIVHGDSHSKLYAIYCSMKARCNNINNKSYKSYGGRGIKISKEWEKWIVFKTWSLNNGYKNNLSIDRINNNGNYESNNCRWTTKDIQGQNTRRLISTNTSGYRGISKRAKKWIAQIGVSGKHIYIGIYLTKIEAAKAYDAYVIKNNLEHTKNFRIKENNE